MTAGPAREVRHHSGRQRGAVLALLGVLIGLLAGCGVRTTPVPVDAGGAPSRVGCVQPGNQETTAPDENSQRGATEAQIYLLCGSRLSPVQRAVSLPDTPGPQGQLAAARTFLNQLQADLQSSEATAGFKTTVPDNLEVDGPQPGDPEEALRLSTPLDELSPIALAQLVCTYVESPAARGSRTVTLGGPAGADDAPLQQYECGVGMRTAPEAARTAGTPTV